MYVPLEIGVDAATEEIEQWATSVYVPLEIGVDAARDAQLPRGVDTRRNEGRCSCVSRREIQMIV